MQGYTHVQLIGSLIQNAELKYTPQGLAILEMTIAGDKQLDTQDGLKEIPFYVRVKTFGRYAEILADDLSAGTVVAVDGRLAYRGWQSQEGEKRSSLDVIASSITRLEGAFSFAEDNKGQKRLIGGINSVTLMGNLTRDAELRHTSSAQAVTRFTVAVNERSEEQERVHFIEVSAWRELAERAADLKKGMPVRVTGRITSESWEDQQGNRRYATRIEASDIYQVARPRQTRDQAVEANDDQFPPDPPLPV